MIKSLSKQSAFRSISIFAFGCLLFSCANNRETIRPVPDEKEQEEPIVWIPKALTDVRKLHFLPYLGFFNEGGTQYVSKLEFDKWFSKSTTETDLGEAIPRGAKINLITIGGGLTAGAQSGGLFRDGQQAAYPNLVAKQMGMSDFKTPLFDATHANGTGFISINAERSRTFFNIDNNLGTTLEDNGKPIQFSPYSGKVNNYATPWLSTYEIFDSRWEEEWINKSVNANGVSWPAFLPYAARFIPISHFAEGTIFNYITDNQPYNFFILEINAEAFLNSIRLRNSRTIGLSDFIWDLQEGENYTLKAIQKFKRNGSNGAIFTVPQYRYLAVSSWNNNIVSPDELAQLERGIEIVNKFLREWAKSNNLALVDLDDLYKRVAEGKIKIGKNIPVNNKFDGNFFSSDGIYPSTLGQAFVANEVIKAINLQYKSNIQPIDIEKYLTSIGFKY